MQTLTKTRAGVHNAPMTGYKTGAATRRKILLALLEREPRTIRGLAAVAGQAHPAMISQLRRMKRDGLVDVAPGVGRSGSKVTLTPAGRVMALDMQTLTD